MVFRSTKTITMTLRMETTMEMFVNKFSLSRSRFPWTRECRETIPILHNDLTSQAFDTYCCFNTSLYFRYKYFPTPFIPGIIKLPPTLHRPSSKSHVPSQATNRLQQLTRPQVINLYIPCRTIPWST